MTNWNKRFMDLARHISTWSKDTSTKNASVIVDDDNTVLSFGYNGFPRGANDKIDSRYERPQKYLYTEHAERNAIYNAVRTGVCLKGGIMYVTMFPCIDCARAIINSGIKTLVTYEPEFSHKRWGESWRIAFEMFKECDVKIVYFSDEFDSFSKEVECFKKLEWDYNYESKVNNEASNYYSQRDWNHTLMTMINQASASIVKENLIISANKIRLNSILFPIVKDLMFFDDLTFSLGTKYDVVIDDNLPGDGIVVYYDGRNGYCALTEEEFERGVKEKEKKSNYVLIKVLNYK